MDPISPLVNAISRRIAQERDEPTFQRDPEFLRRHLATTTRLVNLFSPEVRGSENIPATGPALVVGNHSGLFWMPDVWAVSLEIVRRRGLEQPAYAMIYDLLLAIPGVGPYLRHIGALPASGSEAQAALDDGALVLDYPGGDWEACRPWTQRNRIDLGGHRGFVRLALQAGVPVVPVVTHGSHQTVVVVSRGERLSRLMGLGRLRIHVFPFVLGPPFGVMPLLTPPMPSAITVQFLPALDWARFGPATADDARVVDRCYAEITSTMQAALDRLAHELPHPVVRGVTNMVRHGPRRIAVPTP
ncbi:MAG TPA: lysophospholipid acyltransferase family protein [Acidimicrobiales bacterium]|nr:lysophospholipid acyltransferase family protein [Acidimicrobiales bacterium]